MIKPESKTDNPIETKRKIVKAIAGSASLFAGSQGLPDSWIRPVISTAFLPAHADTSTNCDFDISFGFDDDLFGINFSSFAFSADVPNGTPFTIEFNSEDAITSAGPDLNGVIEEGTAGDFEIDNVQFESTINNTTELGFVVDFENGAQCGSVIDLQN